MMRIYTKSGDLAFKTFNFPDQQPHFILETYEQEFRAVTIEMAIKTPSDLFTLLLANDVLRQHGYAEVSLDVRYLMGARMDRAIDALQPFTLQTISRLVNGAGFSRVRLLDVHSDVATKLIRNSTNVLPFEAFTQATLACGSPAIVVPDKGAIERVTRLAKFEATGPIIYCEKTRDMATGALSGFKVNDYHSNDKLYTENVLIVDDICDGGGTFVGLAKVLRANGAKKVNLFVTHNVQYKDRLEGINKIFTTDSFSPQRSYMVDGAGRELVVIPISMEKLK